MNPITLSDGHTTLYVDCQIEVGDALIFTMSDGGGFSSLYVTETDWKAFKMLVDNFIKEKVNEPAK